ncbi:MAG: cytochrome c [Betaproteobacteria bacterium]|nr:MAG: cytochrome c [Betaproteobacteria bacterium]
MKRKSLIAASVLLAGLSAVVAAESPTPSPEKAAEEKAVNLCSTCHGPRGVSTSPEFPHLAGQREPYLVRQIRAFRDHARVDKDAQDFMWGVARQLDEATVDAIARYYAAQSPAPGRADDAALAMKGKELFDRGMPDRAIPPCATCHGQNAEGQGEFPRLAGQHAKYVSKQIRFIQSESRTTAPAHAVVKNLDPDEVKAVAAYVQSR